MVLHRIALSLLICLACTLFNLQCLYSNLTLTLALFFNLRVLAENRTFVAHLFCMFTFQLTISTHSHCFSICNVLAENRAIIAAARGRQNIGAAAATDSATGGGDGVGRAECRGYTQSC
jgi:hypothetical protein